MRLKLTAPAVKDVLKPMYISRHISKEVFKAAAEAATSELADTIDPKHMTEEDVLLAVQASLQPHGFSLPE